MTRNALNVFSTGTVVTILAATVICVFTAAAFAQEVNLTLQDAPLTVLKDSSVTKTINGIPADTPGRIELEIKWHAASFVPNTFNMLKVELMRGSNVVSTKFCYSVHSGSDKTPKCYVEKYVNETEANASGAWKLRVSNNSDHDVNGFNIVKEATDLNPFVNNVKSYFLPDCAERYLDFFGADEVNIVPNDIQEVEFLGVQRRAGEIHIRAKWHSQYNLDFHKLKVQLLHNDSVVATDEGYSIHSDQKGKTDRINIKYNKPATTQIGVWKLRISSPSTNANIKGFNIEKGSDLNPFVPNFRSTFKPCN